MFEDCERRRQMDTRAWVYVLAHLCGSLLNCLETNFMLATNCIYTLPKMYVLIALNVIKLSLLSKKRQNGSQILTIICSLKFLSFSNKYFLKLFVIIQIIKANIFPIIRLWVFFRGSRAPNSAVGGPIWPNFELLKAFMHSLITYKYKPE